MVLVGHPDDEQAKQHEHPGSSKAHIQDLQVMRRLLIEEEDDCEELQGDKLVHIDGCYFGNQLEYDDQQERKIVLS